MIAHHDLLNMSLSQQNGKSLCKAGKIGMHNFKWQAQIQTGYYLLREFGCAELGCFKIGMGW